MTTPVQTPRVLSTLKRPSPPAPKNKKPPAQPHLDPPFPKSPGPGVNLSRSMKRLLRRLSRVAAADASYEPLRSNAAAKASSAASSSPSSSSFFGARRLGSSARVPEGHVPVCVGEEGGPVERFAVRAELLGRPAFAALLRRAAQEYGYGHPGALRIPCAVADFHSLLLGLSDAGADDDDAPPFYY